MRYVIIGNGILGLSAAFRLTQRLNPSDEIIVVGPIDRTGCATLAAGAMLNSFGEISAASFKSDYDMYHFELSHLATRKWPDFERELIDAAGDKLPSACAKCQVLSGGCFDRGTYIINNSAADEWDDLNFQAIVNALKEFDEPHEIVHASDIPNYHPAQHMRAAQGVYIHNEGWLNPKIVIEKMDAIMERSDITTQVDSRVERIIHQNGSISGIEITGGDVIEGDVFLLAAGAPTHDILKKSEIDIAMQRVFYGVGVSIEIKAEGRPHTKCVRTPNRGGACGIYTVPYFKGPDEANDHILIGASNRLQPVPVYHGRIGSIAHLMEAATQEINTYFYAARLICTNVGWRPTSEDTYPLVGKTSVDNLIIATGTKRDGFHLSPVLSEYVASIMMGEAVDERFAMFAPEREIIRDIGREEGIEIIVSSLMSEQYQHGYVPSGPLMNNQLRDSYRRDIEELHDSIGATDWAIHPELVNMYRFGHASVKPAS